MPDRIFPPWHAFRTAWGMTEAQLEYCMNCQLLRRGRTMTIANHIATMSRKVSEHTVDMISCDFLDFAAVSILFLQENEKLDYLEKTYQTYWVPELRSRLLTAYVKRSVENGGRNE